MAARVHVRTRCVPACPRRGRPCFSEVEHTQPKCNQEETRKGEKKKEKNGRAGPTATRSHEARFG